MKPSRNVQNKLKKTDEKKKRSGILLSLFLFIFKQIPSENLFILANIENIYK